MPGLIAGGVACAIVLLFFAVILIRTLRFKPEPLPPATGETVSLDRDKIVSDMADMIRCRTVSHRDGSLTDFGEFEKFRALLAERFPRVHGACTLRRLGETGLLYHLPGKCAEEPTVCMSHYDVVPVEEDLWHVPAFEGRVTDGYIWGRGALDTKGTLCGVMEALEYLLGEGYVPERDLYLSFSGDEEIDGPSCPAIVSWFEENGITPGFVLDEGGAVVERVFPGVTLPSAMVGIAEKGGVNLEFSMVSEGGHASTPPPHTIVGKLAKAITRIEAKPFPSRLTKPVREMFDTMGRHSGFLYRMIFANLWCFFPLLDLLARKSGGDMNAMLRTTVAVTRMQGSEAYNVLPSHAGFGVNLRLLGEDTVESVQARLKDRVDNDKIEVRLVSGMDPSPCSVTEGRGWDTLKAVIQDTWEGTVVTPYLMMACSDSRHYCRISDKVYRFSPMKLTKEERATIHGHDERISVDTLVRTAEFYVRLLRRIG